MHHTRMLSIDFCVLLVSSLNVILHMIELTHRCSRITLSNVSLITNMNKSLKIQTLLKFFEQHVHASVNEFDTSMDNSKMATLSMEPRKQIIILHNNYFLTLIQLAVGI